MKKTLQPPVPKEAGGKVIVGEKRGWTVRPFLAEYNSPDAALAAVNADWAAQGPHYGSPCVMYCNPAVPGEEVMTCDAEKGKWEHSVYSPEMVGGSLSAAKELNAQYVMAPVALLGEWLTKWVNNLAEELAGLRKTPSEDSQERIQGIEKQMAESARYLDGFLHGHRPGREQQDRYLLERCNERVREIEPARMGEEIAELSGEGRRTAESKADTIIEGGDARIEDRHDLNMVVDSPSVFIVAEADEPVIWRRIVAVADLQVPGHWHVNRHANLAERQQVEALNNRPEVIRAMESKRAAAQAPMFLARDTVEITLGLHSHVIAEIHGGPDDWNKYGNILAEAGRAFNDEVKESGLERPALDVSKSSWPPHEKFVEAMWEAYASDENPLEVSDPYPVLREIARGVVKELQAAQASTAAYLPDAQSRDQETLGLSL